MIFNTKNKSKLTIGPLTSQSRIDHDLPKLSNNINHIQQRLHRQIRFHPAVIYLATDLTLNQTRDTWMRQNQHNEFSVISAISIDEDMKRNNFLFKHSNDEKSYKLDQSRHILDRFRFLILDANFKQCHFPRDTIVNFSLVIRPHTFNY